MNNDITIIRELCQKYPFESKLIIIPSMSMKNQILKSLNDEGIYPMNLEVTTVTEIALRLIEPMMLSDNLILLSNNDVVELVRMAFEKLHLEGKLYYFDAIEATTGLYKAVAGTLLEMKSAGWKQGMIDLQLIMNADKRNDIDNLMKTYNGLLSQSDYVDMSDIINLALEPAKTSITDVRIHVIEGSVLTYQDEQLLKNIGWSPINEDDSILLDYRRAVTHLEDLALKKAYGIHSEVKEVVRTILKEKLPFDQVLIVAMSNSPYSQVLYKLISQYSMNNDEIESNKRMPVTFSAGIPATITTPVKLLLAMLDWIDSGYAVHGLVRLLSDGVMKLDSMILNDQGEQVLSRSQLIITLRASGITWQRSTYIPVLDSLSASHLNRAEAAKVLGTFLMDEVFEVIPEAEADGTISVVSFMEGIKSFVSKNAIIKSEVDSQGLSRICDELNTVIQDMKLPLSELITVIRNQITSMNVAEESPTEGKMHFTTIRGAEWIQRKYVFLIGNDANTFLKTGNEDPVLLDKERSNTLKKSSERYADDLKSVSRFFIGVKVPITASYSYFDTSNNRDMFPSLIFQAMQEVTKGEVEKIDMLLRSSDDAIDEVDYITMKSVMSVGTVEGPVDENDANRDVVVVEEQPYHECADPRKNGLVLSSSMLQTYMECGYKYFLKYILNVKELSSIELDRLGWLSHFEIGKLYHSVFETFMKETQANHEVLSNDEIAIKAIEQIAHELIEDYESRLPVASEYHTEKEKMEILRNCRRFAVNEVEQKDLRIPLKFEYAFGHEQRLEITMPDGSSVGITGVVDRMDRLKKDNSIKITDYKTGSTYGYDILEDTDADLINTKTIQPIMYYMALKTLGYQDIKAAEYAFVTSKGDYDSFEVSFEGMTDLMINDGFTELLNRMSTGKYEFADNESNCRYCGYAEICNRQEEVEE